MAKKSLRDQLMEAGFRSNKMENHRESTRGREKKQAEKHQTTRNFCEHCSLVHPDVELYKHRMPTTEAEWMCLSCVDKLMIDDRFRKTRQSDVSKKGMFRRYFGATKDFDREENTSRKSSHRNGNSNKSSHTRNKTRGGNF